MEEKTNNNDWISSPPDARKLALMRTRSEQLPEAMLTVAADDTIGGRMLTKKFNKRSPGQSGRSSSKNSSNAHIRKSRSAQLKLDGSTHMEHYYHHHNHNSDNVSSGAALSRASSASLGFSFSFTGFTVPSEDVANSKPFSDDDISEDLEAGIEKNKKKMIQAEPTLPIYLKERAEIYIAIKGPMNMAFMSVCRSDVQGDN